MKHTLSTLVLFLFYIQAFCASHSVDELLSAQEHHDAVLRGQFFEEVNDPNRFLTLSELVPIDESHQGLLGDGAGNTWLVKQSPNSINEYLGAKLLNLFIPSSPEVKLFKDAPGYIATQYSPEFRIHSAINEANNKPIIGEFELNIAMDLIGLGHRCLGTMGYIEKNDFLVATRIDFDRSFQYLDFDFPLDRKLYLCSEFYKNSNEAKIALEQILNISDESIYYVLGNAYRDLLAINAEFDCNEYQKLAPALIARKALFAKNDTNRQVKCEYSPTLFTWIIKEHRLDILDLLIEHHCNPVKMKTVELYSKGLQSKEKLNTIKLLLESAKVEQSYLPLHWAIRTSNSGRIQSLLQKNTDPNAQDDEGRTPLHYAINKQNLQFMKLLLQYYADPNIQDKQGLTPLHYAIIKQNLALVDLLLRNDADPNIPDNQNKTPFDWAIEKDYIEIIAKLLPLHHAIKHEYLDTLEYLLQTGINPNMQDSQGRTPLHWAVNTNNISFVQLLLDYNANPNIQDLNDATPLHWAAKYSHLEIIKLLQALVDSNMQGSDVTTLMHWAASNKQWDIAKYFLEQGANPNTTDRQGYTFLYKVIDRGHLDLLKLLLEEYHIDPNSDLYEFMPLHLAIEKGHPHLVKLLLEKNADPNLENENGYTPLGRAAMLNQVATIEILSEYGVDIKLHVGPNSTLLHTLIARKIMGSFGILLEKGADPNARDDGGYTVLDIAIFYGRIEAIQPLLDHNVNLTTKDKKGQTPYYQALNANQWAIAELIAEKMPKKTWVERFWKLLDEINKKINK